MTWKYLCYAGGGFILALSLWILLDCLWLHYREKRKRTNWRPKRPT